jgi:hypothetical protein
VRQPSDHGVTRRALAPAPAAPLIRVHDPTSDHGAIRFEALPDSFEPKLVKAAERGQVRTSEGSVVHVEVFQMGSVT